MGTACGKNSKNPLATPMRNHPYEKNSSAPLFEEAAVSFIRR